MTERVHSARHVDGSAFAHDDATLAAAASEDLRGAAAAAHVRAPAVARRLQPARDSRPPSGFVPAVGRAPTTAIRALHNMATATTNHCYVDHDPGTTTADRGATAAAAGAAGRAVAACRRCAARCAAVAKLTSRQHAAATRDRPPPGHPPPLHPPPPATDCTRSCVACRRICQQRREANRRRGVTASSSSRLPRTCVRPRPQFAPQWPTVCNHRCAPRSRPRGRAGGRP